MVFYPLFSSFMAFFQAQSNAQRNDDTGVLLFALGFVLLSMVAIIGIVLAALRPESAEFWSIPNPRLNLHQELSSLCEVCFTVFPKKAFFFANYEIHFLVFGGIGRIPQLIA